MVSLKIKFSFQLNMLGKKYVEYQDIDMSPKKYGEYQDIDMSQLVWLEGKHTAKRANCALAKNPPPIFTSSKRNRTPYRLYFVSTILEGIA